jgi:cell division protein FtsB
MTPPRRTQAARPGGAGRSRTPAGRAATAPRPPSRSRTTAGTALLDLTDGSAHPAAAPDDPPADPAADRGNAGRNRLTGRAAVLLMVLVMLGVAYAWPMREYLHQRSQLGDLRAATRAAQQKVDALQAEKERWADPAYVKAQARARLHYVMPGEVSFVVLHPNQANLVQTLPKTSPPAQAWYDALWTSLHGADDPSTTSRTP